MEKNSVIQSEIKSLEKSLEKLTQYVSKIKCHFKSLNYGKSRNKNEKLLPTLS